MNIQDIKTQKKVHFIGLGGIGMSALAFILREWNIAVQGSDLKENYLTEKLRKSGALYFVGHKAENINDDVTLVVQTSIIKSDNPEILRAKEKNIPIITRAELLDIIMQDYIGITIAGTHGKTSTTGMVSLMLEIGGLDPTIINGGIINYFGCNSKIGKGDFLVAESDESDGSFVNLPTIIGAITNIEPEHLEAKVYNGNFEKQKAYFEQYITQIPDDGLCVVCIDNPILEGFYNKYKNDYNITSYSIKKNADIMARNFKMDINGITFDVLFGNNDEIKNIFMPVYGEHNASNALVAIAIAVFLNIGDEKIKEALSKFNGVKRRFTKVGEFNGASIIDDYGHHPTEIATTLKAARNLVQNKKLICVFQPHKYSRVKDLFKEFCQAFFDADIVIVSDIYSASQAPIEGINQDSVIDGIKNAGHKNVIKLNNENELSSLIKPLINQGDIVFFTGAGTITSWAHSLQEQLQKL